MAFNAAIAIIDEELPRALEALYPTNTSEHGRGDGSASDTNADARRIDVPDKYWAEYLRAERFGNMRQGLLYRPNIILSLLDDIEKGFGRRDMTGIMVQGPQGIGKSHTLVNLNIFLESCPKYHVTFLPDCVHWGDISYFATSVFASFGIDLDTTDTTGTAKGFTIDSAMANTGTTIRLLDMIDDMLEERNIKWIFLFDQVNAIFGRPAYNQIKNVHNLPFPFNLLGRLYRKNRVLPIICASSDSEISHREGHEGFKDFHHPIELNLNEATILFPGHGVRQIEKALEDTGAIALQMHQLIVEKEFNEDEYWLMTTSAINRSAKQLGRQLEQDRTYGEFVEGIIQTLLKAPTTAPYFDRKYFVKYPRGSKYFYEPLFPLVEEVYMKMFWDNVMEHIEEREEQLLRVCIDTDVDQGSRGRHFELIVIRRCMKGSFNIPIGADDSGQQATIPMRSTRFDGNTLPNANLFFSEGGIMVPNNPNFPAIDILWYTGRNRLIGVQIHVSDHENTITSFEGLCREKGLNNHFDSIEMWYLSPTQTAANRASGLCGRHDCRTSRNSPERWSITVKAKTINDISCLQNLPWGHPSNRI